MTYQTRNEISLGDLAIAVKKLPTNDRQVLSKIAACLGFGLEVPEPPKPPRKGVWDKSQSPQREEPSEKQPHPPTPPAAKKTRDRVSLPKPPVPVDGYITRIEPLKRQPSVLPDFIKQAQPISLDTIPATHIRREPIFAKRSERAILAAAIGVQSAAGMVDLDAMLDRLVHLKFVDKLPRRALATLKFGVQIMLDHSESMLPYLEDCQTLEARLKQIAGSFRCSSRWFKGSPLSIAKFQKNPQPLKLVKGVPILLVSDFGIAAPLHSRDRARPGDWSRFVQQARKKDCPVVALIPHKPRFWSEQVVADFLCIHWNRSTSAGDLRKVIGVGHLTGG